MLWPHRSMTTSGFTWMMGLLFVGLAIPLIPFLGTPVGWALLPFLGGTLWIFYTFVMRNYRDANLNEVVKLWPDLITVERTERDGSRKRWFANPFWVELKLHDNARIERYLTLKGNGREIELGAFLSPEEREALHDDLDTAFRTVR
ncbi:MAG: DUF2244 domain-containing protein [Pseudomonadota bacterium]